MHTSKCAVGLVVSPSLRSMPTEEKRKMFLKQDDLSVSPIHGAIYRFNGLKSQNYLLVDFVQFSKSFQARGILMATPLTTFWYFLHAFIFLTTPTYRQQMITQAVTLRERHSNFKDMIYLGRASRTAFMLSWRTGSVAPPENGSRPEIISQLSCPPLFARSHTTNDLLRCKPNWLEYIVVLCDGFEGIL